MLVLGGNAGWRGERIAPRGWHGCWRGWNIARKHLKEVDILSNMRGEGQEDWPQAALRRCHGAWFFMRKASPTSCTAVAICYGVCVSRADNPVGAAIEAV
ncbi:hypothetical protein [Chromobacterium sphagni]|uniref:hypothetical protein n=1 Tax=Chromobacterium sphagni TaxID=1903179 RepID=UPI00111354FD|nr:hypothetical protein [Chromobacterium sphagni]